MKYILILFLFISTTACSQNKVILTAPTVTASSSDWAGIAIEIKSAARRRMILD